MRRVMTICAILANFMVGSYAIQAQTESDTKTPEDYGYPKGYSECMDKCLREKGWGDYRGGGPSGSDDYFQGDVAQCNGKCFPIQE